MWKRLRTNLAYRILSLLLAVGLWVYITDEKNPNTDNMSNVPLEIRNSPSDLVVADKQATVRVRFEGREEIVRKVSSRDIAAYVDLGDAQIGKLTRPVQVSLPPGVNLVSVYPDQAAITLDRVTEKQVPVTVSYEGKPAMGYQLQEPVLKPSHVLVSGPSDHLAGIQRAFVKVDVDGLRSNYLEHLPLQVTSNREGNQVRDWVDLRPETVEVFVPVAREMPDRIVPVEVDLQGSPAAGYRLGTIITEPQAVRVYGPQEVLTRLDKVKTVPLDINGASSLIVQELELAAPAQVIVANPQLIKVMIQVDRQPPEQKK